MATGPITQIADVIVPEIFTPYTQQITEQKSRLIQSGAVVRNSEMDSLLDGGGLTFHMPSFKDLDNDAENVSTDAADDSYTGGNANSVPKKTGTLQEIAVRLNRNQSWSSADLAANLAGADPMDSIANRVGYYWTRRMQAAFIATMTGIFADNDAAPSGSEHVQGDLTNNVSGSSFSAGVTNFTSSAFLDALVTMGDSQDQLAMVMVHSIVFNTMQKANLIDFIPDSEGRIAIPTYLGRQVIVDDGITNTGGVFQSWIFGTGAVQFGVGQAKVPTETQRKPDSGNGGGSDVLYNRVVWSMHPTGHRYVGTAPSGGPSNANTTNNLAAATSWQRAYAERKQIKIARLITREF